ncbi:Adenylosuccinate synthase [Haliangium ochraceum DSM 14365]|uniref:Adenylosuccinate synthetase n=1 Tax=Haliangium ochraceum (strain DSM 14365 / JCM 11303 / SMP-2) TaxID=502025 RepID=D0LLN0_HALO1|nr:Adenylosuccinate synthase [Haliangium ochraceum DSM 14365]
MLGTRDLIRALVDVDNERSALQKAGAALDRKTRGKWVAKALGKRVQEISADATIVVDAVRDQRQINAVRNAFGARVQHVHLHAAIDELAQRYANRQSAVKEAKSYKDVQNDSTEKRVRKLARSADIVVDTGRSSAEDVFVRVASHLGLYGRSPERLVDVLIGGQYGSEGKGHIASYLSPEYDVLVRVGGPNAGHKVYEKPEPRTFHHLPSGTQRSESRGSKIVLGPGIVLFLPGLLREIADCALSKDRLSIDPNAMLIDESDRHFESETLASSIGSTAQGVGSATARRILRTAADPPVRLAGDENTLKPYIRESGEVLEGAFASGCRVFLEGTQGTGLSLFHGFYPHVTSRDTSVSGCLAEAGIAPSRVRRIIMVCRTYPIRVESPNKSTSGRLAQELEWTDIASRSGIPIEELRKNERTSTTNKSRRVGEFDWSLLRRAAFLNGPTDVALTFADYLSVKNRDARRFEQLTLETINFVEEVERVAAAPVSLIATRFHFRSIIDRRAW